MRLSSPAALAAAAFVFLAVPTASAAPPCGPRADVVGELEQRYREAPVAVGLAGNGTLVEVLASPDGATWTILQTAPSGLACLVAAGESWQTRAAARPDDGPAL
jgi:hypothetical protein